MKYLLADYLRDQARWRLGQAEDYDDDRTARSAEALEDAATFVEQLPDDDLRLMRIDAAYHVTDLDEFYPGPRGKHLISVWGFQRTELLGSPETFLGSLAECSEDDAVELFLDSGEQDLE